MNKQELVWKILLFGGWMVVEQFVVLISIVTKIVIERKTQKHKKPKHLDILKLSMLFTK